MLPYLSLSAPMTRPGKKVASEMTRGAASRCAGANTMLVITIAALGEKNYLRTVCIHPRKNVSSITAAASPDADMRNISPTDRL